MTMRTKMLDENALQAEVGNFAALLVERRGDTDSPAVWLTMVRETATDEDGDDSGAFCLSADEARALALVLTAMADEADRLDGTDAEEADRGPGASEETGR